MSDFSPVRVTELICTRLSHDLIGNIGAVSNALELMDDDPSCLSDVRPILEISAKTLTARLKFFRQAFGLDNVCPKTMTDLSSIIEAYLATIGTRSAPIILDLNVSTLALYKIILPAVMALGDVFIRGGTLSVCENRNGLLLKAESPSPLSASKAEALKDTLKGLLPEENPSLVAPMAYLTTLLADKKVAIRIKAEPNSFEILIG